MRAPNMAGAGSQAVQREDGVRLPALPATPRVFNTSWSSSKALSTHRLSPASLGDGHSPSSLISKNWTPMANDFSSWFTTLRGRGHRGGESCAWPSVLARSHV